ncbi:MAG: chemotaxis protein CheX, partial [Bdellovibrionota bacterium]
KRIVEVVLDAVAYAFKFYGKITISPQEPRFWSEKEAPLIEIAGTAGIVSKSFRGSVVLGFPLKTFLAVVSRILDTPSTRIESSNRDWPAELLNVVLGQTRAALSQEEIEVSTAIPTVVHGASFEMIHSKAASCIVIPLKSDCGDLFLQVSTIRA